MSIVIVGAGLAGGTAATELREQGHTGPVVLIGAEPHPPYERPPLSKDLLLGKDADPVVHDQQWYADHDVTLHLGSRVSSIDLDGRRSRPTASDGVRHAGAGRRRPAAGVPDGRRQRGPVTYLRTLDEALALKEQLGEGRRIAIVGAGWIGLEVAAAARENGATVSVLEAAERPLLRVLGPEVAQIFAELHRQHGVDLRLGAEITAIRSTGSGGVVELAAGDPVGFDLPVVGVGVEPVVDVAGAAGLSIDNGIRVDDHLRAATPTCPPSATSPTQTTQGWAPLRVEHGTWSAARRRGRGHRRRRGRSWTAAPYFFTDQYDLGMEYVGNPGPDGFDRVVLRGDTDASQPLRFTAFWVRGSEVVAAMQVNDWDATDELRAAVASGDLPPAP